MSQPFLEVGMGDRSGRPSAWSAGWARCTRGFGDARVRPRTAAWPAASGSRPSRTWRRLAVSRSTVVTTYDALRSEGLLESRQGSGLRIGRSVATGPTRSTRFRSAPSTAR